MDIRQLFGLKTRSAAPRNEHGELTAPPREPLEASLETLTTLEAVYRSLTYLQTVAGQLTIDAIRGDQPRDDISLISQPDPYMTQRDWIVENVAALSTHGNSFWKINRNEAGQVIGLHVLAPEKVQLILTSDGQTARYQVGDRTYSRHEIAHCRYMVLPGRARGLGPIEAGRRGLIGSVQVSRYGDRIFQQGGIPQVVLTTDQPLTQEQADQAERNWYNKQHAGKAAILQRGLKVEAIGLSPADIQWLDSQKFSVTKVARLFGIPPTKLAAGVDGDSMTYQNLEGVSLQFVRDTLMGYLSPIESALSALLPHGTSARFNLDAFLRPDTKTRYEAHEIGIRSGFLTVNEVRSMEKRPPLVEESNSEDRSN